MKHLKDIEKFIRDEKPNVKTSNQLDKLIIDGSYSTMEETIQAKSLSPKSSIFTLLLRNNIAVGAVAAAIVLVAGLFVFHLQLDEDINIPKAPKVTQSPAEMLTLRSLKIAYYNGGIDAVEAQCDDAVKQLKLKSNKITVNELLADINGT